MTYVGKVDQLVLPRTSCYLFMYFIPGYTPVRPFIRLQRRPEVFGSNLDTTLQHIFLCIDILSLDNGKKGPEHVVIKFNS
jgi:hypothetical protein